MLSLFLRNGLQQENKTNKDVKSVVVHNLNCSGFLGVLVKFGLKANENILVTSESHSDTLVMKFRN